MQVMEEIANAHDKTIAQVAINWLITQERVKVVPIPGGRSAKQAVDHAGAKDWSLSSNVANTPGVFATSVIAIKMTPDKGEEGSVS